MATKTKRRVQRNQNQRNYRPSQARRDAADEKPRKTAGTRRDGWTNDYSGHGTASDRRTKTDFNTVIVGDVYGLELLRSDDIMARIAELLPREAMRRGVQVKLSGQEDGKEIAEGMHAEIERLDLVEKVRHARTIERACGGAALMPVFDGAIGDLEEDLADYEDGIVGVLALHVLEPRELQPVQWYTDITDPKFRKPMKYRLTPLSGATGKPLQPVIIHESRLVIFEGVRVSNQLRSGQRVGWGDSVYNRCFEVVADFGLGWGSAATIIHDFAHGIYKLADLEQILARKDGDAALARRLSSMDQMRSSLRSTVIAKDDEFSRTATSVGGLADLLVQLAQRLAAAADMPVTLLMGMSPAGLNATGESDIRGWYDRVEAERGKLRHKIEQIIRWLWLAGSGPTEGVEPEQWSIEWPPLWQPSEKEVADYRKVVADTDNVYFTMGLDADTIFKSRWKGDTYSGDMNVDWVAYEKQKALDDQKAAELDAASLQAMGHGQPTDPADPNAPAPDPADPTAKPKAATAPTAPGRRVSVKAHDRQVNPRAQRTDAGWMAEGTPIVVTRGDHAGARGSIIEDFESHVAAELAGGECIAIERDYVARAA